MRITIRTRILSIFVGVALIQVLLLGAFFLNQHNKTRRNHVTQQLHTVSENVNAQLSIFLNSILHDLETASQQVERMAQKDYQRYNLLKTLKNNNAAFAALVFYDINGIVRSGVTSNNNERILDYFEENLVADDKHIALVNVGVDGHPHITVVSLDGGVHGQRGQVIVANIRQSLRWMAGGVPGIRIIKPPHLPQVEQIGAVWMTGDHSELAAIWLDNYNGIWLFIDFRVENLT